MVCNLMSAGCQSTGRHSLTPSPDGSVIASIDSVNFDIMGPEPIHIHRGAYLRIQRIKQSREPGFRSIQIADKSEYFSRSGGLYWSPNGRSIAFTTFPKAIRSETCRLWIVDIYAQPKKTLIAEDVYSFRWVDDTHMVYVTQDGDVIQATISDGGDIHKLEPLFSVGDLRDADGRLAYHYPGLYGSGGYKFNNPLSPNAQFFVYGDGQDLKIVNLSIATIEKSFPLTGTPIIFWWDDGSSNLLIGVHKKKKGKYGYSGDTHHYYLYQQESGTLTNLINRLEDTSQFSPYEPSGHGRVWLSDGKHFILHSGYPYYKTWLFNKDSLSAVWMEREMERFESGNFSQRQRLIATLPLKDGEVDSSKEPLPKSPRWDDPNFSSLDEKHSKMIEKNSSSRVVIEPSPAGNLLALRLPEGSQKHEKQTSTCYVLKIVTDPKGEISLDIIKKVESGIKKRFLWIDWIDEYLYWTANGRGLLFTDFRGDKFRLESIP
jgi:hypothetical protein